MWLDDLNEVVGQLGFDYRMQDGRTLQDYCPRCKRIMRGKSYLAIYGKGRDVSHASRAEENRSD
jgi:hypothetical protein